MSENTEDQKKLEIKRHAKYLLRCLGLLPPSLGSQDSIRTTIAFFSICGIDVLNCLDMIRDQDKSDTIEWIYSTQIIPDENEPKIGGFMGTTTIKVQTDNELLLKNLRKYQCGHLPLTYTSIAILVTLGDDLSRINKKAVIEGLETAQNENGSFSVLTNDANNEQDMRIVFCAAAICFMLNDWGNVDKVKMKDHILKCITFDYGISQEIDGESHGGTTYCGLAALVLSDQLDALDSGTRDKILRWLINRQVDGFEGRPNKVVDTCYSFWLGASLKMLNGYHFIDFQANRESVIETQNSVIGGFSKWPMCETDPYHTYFGICGLSFMNEPGLGEVMPSLNISMRAYNHLKMLHSQWGQK